MGHSGSKAEKNLQGGRKFFRKVIVTDFLGAKNFPGRVPHSRTPTGCGPASLGTGTYVVSINPVAFSA